MTTLEIISAISGIVAILGSIATVIYWFVNKDFNSKKNVLANKTDELKEENKYLRGQINEYEEFGISTISAKKNIDTELQNIAKTIGAKSGTAYIPFPQVDNLAGLKIISITPLNNHTSKLYNQLIPLSSIAGSVFNSKKAQFTHNANSSNHYKAADLISGYTTTGMLTVPVMHNEKVIAILQLFNSEEKAFSDDMLSTATSLVSKTNGLSDKVSAFTRLPGWQQLFRTKNVYQSETIMFCDLTSSSILFNELNIDSTFDHLNNFFEEISNVALAYGALIDNYTGDGVLFRFVNQDTSMTFESSLIIREKFNDLKTRWEEESSLFSSIYIRIGIANGPVVEHIVGHPQHQSISVFGQAVNVAVNLCNIAPRDRNIIIVSSDFKTSLNQDLLKELKIEKVSDTGKASAYSADAELIAYLVE